jgi:hypothetical protein
MWKVVLGSVVLLSHPIWAQPEAAAPASPTPAEPAAGDDSEELAKKLSNPIANLVSVPFQFNWDAGVGPEDATRFLLNVQPVVPFSISRDWNLIGRWILPMLSQPALSPGGESEFGFGDIVFSTFFSPKESSITWGVGPVFGLPTTTEPTLGSGKWQAGPTLVVLQQSGPWTYGALANHLWSFADTGDVERGDVSNTFVQPFIAYATPKGITYSINAEAGYNWKAADDQELTLPINLSISKITRFGPFPMSLGAGAGYYVEHPDIGPEWKLRTIFTLILPRSK